MARGGASGGGGRSSGGGGRSFGGGGNRSFGGRSGGGGFSRGGVSGGGRGGPVGGGYRPPPPRHGGMGGFGMGYGMGRMAGGGWGRGYRGYRRPFFGSGGCGCLVVPVGLIVLVMVLSIFLFAIPSGGGSTGGTTGQVTASTIEREPLPKGSVNETDYYTDALGWVTNSTTLTAGMKNFYQKTGVQPYLYLTDTIDGSHSPTEAQVEQFAGETYDALFTDEAHLLLIFFEYNSDGNYHTWYMGGNQAKTVLDSEAMDILLDYIDKYYYDSTLTDDQMFSKAFDEAGERIMKVTRSPWVPVLIVAGVLAILVVIFLWWRSYKKQKNIEAEQNAKILNTPLETFGDTEAEQRAKKYDN